MTQVPQHVVIGDVATIERGIVEAARVKTGSLYIGLENIESGGRLTNVKSVANGELASSKFAFTPQHVLFGKLRPYLAKIARPDFEGICSTDILPVLPGPKLDRGYLAWFLLTPQMVSLAASRATGANLPRLSPKALAQLQIPLPPLPEQRRIADILDKADVLRAKRRAALAQLDELTQSIFLDMFGDPATNPKCWPVRPVREVLAVPPIFGTMIPASEERGSWLCIRVANIQNWNLNLTDSKYVELPRESVLRHSVQDGDVLFARAIATREHLGKAIVVYPSDRQWAFDSHLMRLRLRQDACVPEYLRELLRSPGGRSRFLRATRRSAVQFNINTKELSALQLPIAPIGLQRSFLSHLRTIERLRADQNESIQVMNRLFASFQHRAFRGEL